jgi:hypothetical protein
LNHAFRQRRRLGGLAAVGLALAAGCAKPPPDWQRPDVSAATARAVELDCHQRAIQAFDPGNDLAEAKRIHEQREQYVERCMRGSGFERR